MSAPKDKTRGDTTQDATAQAVDSSGARGESTARAVASKKVSGAPKAFGAPTGVGGNQIVRWILTTIAVLFLTGFIVWPVVNVFRGAFSNGVTAYVHTFYAAPPDPEVVAKLPRRERLAANREPVQAEKTRDSIKMTATVALIVVPLNTIFGLAAAWAISKFEFRGKLLLITLIDLPFSVSPVVAGLVFVLLMGRVGVLGDWATHIHWPWPWSAYWQGFNGHWFPVGFTDWYEGVIFTPLATAIASTFITFPFVARALLPLMESQGTEYEQAAITLGASGKQTFRRVTLPAIKWGLLYGIILCTARAIGEFGAVSVVSGNTDSNDTMPLRIEKIWQSYNTQQAFAVASLLTMVSVFTLLLKVVIDRKQSQQGKTKTTQSTSGAGH